MLSLLLLVAPLTQNTHIVDGWGGPGSHFTDIPPAVAAATAGDTILVRPGHYSGFSTNKNLTVIGSGKSVTKIIGPGAAIHLSTPGHGTFVMAGFDCIGGLGTILGTVVVYNGKLTLLDCDLHGSPDIGLPALRSDFATVHVSRCTFTGSDCVPGISWCSQGGAGAFLRDTLFSAVDCTFQGGNGFVSTTSSVISTAGHGLVVGESEATVSRCDVFGGTGWANWNGHGIHCWAGNTRVSGTANNTLQGGEASTLYAEPHLGVIGTITVHGAINVLPSLGQGIISQGPVTFGEPEFPYLEVQGSPQADGTLTSSAPATVVYDGLVATAPFFFMFGFHPDYDASLASQIGPLLVDIHTAGLVFGTLDNAGHFSFMVPTNVLAPVFGIPIYSQAGTYDAGLGVLRTSNASIVRFSL